MEMRSLLFEGEAYCDEGAQEKLIKRTIEAISLSGTSLEAPIYDASLSMAKQLNMETVAEGVEDQNDWELLRQTGCDLAQGNFVSKPLQAADFPAWLEAWQNRVRNGLIADSA